ncbi:Rieske 2Fe-2S domain-containing protein [Streptomyces chartreusis]|uniref:Rieske 2Fe-2S domain-containing protein n=1 Tax=Streptomyces chartreusis TaxID=1969 RepID=UPI002F910BA1|nr:Rieske 2Fe-2S domain-containing protein [Streptomyces chartreusis]WTA33528.1 Rieske 2Fe-2S domain-containing protein [Streptomyces chartreusis]
MAQIAPPAPTTVAPNPFETGPGTPAGRYLRRYWQPVRLSQDLPAGQAQPITVMGERFTLYRGTGGRAVVTQPGCPHRQTMLSVGNVEGDSLRCMFHGWKFGPDGQCQEAPGQSPRLVERTRLTSYPTHEEFGVIFAYFGEGEPPRFPDIPGFSRRYGKDMMSALVRDCGTYRRTCNYYINVENALDLAHVAYTHRLSSNPSVTEVGFAPEVLRIRDVTVERLDYGIRAVEVEEDSEPVVATVMLPNAMHLLVPQREGFLEQIAWRVPIDDTSHLSYQITSMHVDEAGKTWWDEYNARKKELIARYPATELCAEQVLRGEKTLFDFADHPDLVNIEDHVAQIGIQFVDDAGKENLAQSDKAVLQLRRMFLSRLADLESGAPIPETEW